MTLEQLIEKYNPLSFSLEYNEHKNYYETAEEYILEKCNNIEFDSQDIIDKDKCIETNTIVNLHLYPKTPIGFYSIYGPTLESVVNAMDEALKDE